MLNSSTGTVLQPTKGHSPKHAHYLATLCDLVYYDQQKAGREIREQLNLDAKLVSVDNTQAYVCENEGSIVVGFRGSENPTRLDGLKDWFLTNARNFLVLPEGRIGVDFAAAGVGARFHKGFMEALAEVWDPLYRAVDAAFEKKERPVWVTGHSLGGALALLASWRFHQQFITVNQIYTFGAPMIGNAAAAEAFHKEFPGKIFRYVDRGDLVPRLPTMSMLSNEYGHCQTEIIVGCSKIESAARAISDAAEKTVDGMINGDVTNSIWTSLTGGISSHLMGNYIARIGEELA
ncbi:MAG: Mbeg1-like protein [Planctomycetaceae bacterium]